MGMHSVPAMSMTMMTTMVVSWPLSFIAVYTNNRRDVVFMYGIVPPRVVNARAPRTVVVNIVISIVVVVVRIIVRIILMSPAASRRSCSLGRYVVLGSVPRVVSRVIHAMRPCRWVMRVWYHIRRSPWGHDHPPVNLIAFTMAHVPPTMAGLGCTIRTAIRPDIWRYWIVNTRSAWSISIVDARFAWSMTPGKWIMTVVTIWPPSIAIIFVSCNLTHTKQSCNSVLPTLSHGRSLVLGGLGCSRY